MATVAQTDQDALGTDTATYTFTAQTVGANGGSDIIYIGTGSRTTANADSCSVTVDGVSADHIRTSSWNETGSIRSNAALFAIERNDLPDPTQTDVDVVVTWNATCLRCVSGVLVSPDAVKTATDTAAAVSGNTNLSVNTSLNAIVIGVLFNGNSGADTWVGLTDNADIDAEGAGGNFFSTAMASNAAAETPRTVSCTLDNDFSAKVCASFAEAGGVPFPIFREHYRRMKAA